MAHSPDVKALGLQLRTLGLGQTLASFARKDRFGVGGALAAWLASQEKDLKTSGGRPTAQAVAERWQRQADRRWAQRVEQSAIAFADDLDAMLAVCQAAEEAHLPRWCWREGQPGERGRWSWSHEHREATAMRAALAIELDTVTVEQAREGDTRAMSRLRLALGDDVLLGEPGEDDPVRSTLSSIRLGKATSSLRAELQSLPQDLRHHGLAGTLAALFNRARRGGQPGEATGRVRSALANLLMARLRGHPGQVLGQDRVVPVRVVKAALGRRKSGDEEVEDLALARVLDDEALRWASALKFCVTTLAAAQEN